MQFGAPAAAFPQLYLAIPRLDTLIGHNNRAIKATQPDRSGVPGVWPGTAFRVSQPQGVTLLVGIDPEPTPLASGRLDAPLRQFLAGRPGDMLCAYPNGNLASSGLHPEEVRAACMRLKRLAPAGMRIGQLLRCPANRQRSRTVLERWIYPDADWYALAGYQTAAIQSPESVFARHFNAIRDVAGATARIGIAETASSLNPSAWLLRTFLFAQESECFLFALGVSAHHPFTDSTRDAMLEIGSRLSESDTTQ